MTVQDHIAELLSVSAPKLDRVHPLLASRVKNVIRILACQGLYFGAFMGLRTWEEQDALYAQGRTKPGKRVTKAPGGSSWHNFGLAVDLVEDGDPEKAGIQWSWAKNADYLKIGAVAKQYGLEWGGWWKSIVDYPHVELTGGLTLAQARELYTAGGLPKVWNAVNSFYGRSGPRPTSNLAAV
jgi:peptidoglycan L-alanyl-D-glutamate endopeptidase CwlK